MTLIAEDVLLLLLDDVKGTLPTRSTTDAVLGGAVLAELAALGLVTVDGKKSFWRSGKVRVTGVVTADLHPVLVDALATIAEKERKASAVVTRLGKGLDDRLAAGLAERRILERRDDKRLGLIPRTTWPVLDPTRDNQLRRAVTVCLADGGRPDERTAAIVGLLWAADQAPKAVAANTATTKRQLKQRAKEVADGQWVAKAVKDAITAATASSGGG